MTKRAGNLPKAVKKAPTPKTTTKATVSKIATPKATAVDKLKAASKRVEISKKRRPVYSWMPINPDKEYLAERKRVMSMYPSIEQIARQVHKFEPQDIYNCFLIGMQLQPNLTFNADKHKFCALICCNADGSDKRTPFVLHQDRPAELDTETESHLETDYSTFYITTEIFTRWLQALDVAMAAQDRKIALLYDNYLVKVEPADRAQFKNISMIRVGLLLDKLAQPMDSGIAIALKMRYAQRVVDELDTMRETATTPNEDTIRLESCWKHFVAAWEEGVTAEKIRHCFASCCTVPVDLQKLLKKKPKKTGGPFPSSSTDNADTRKELSGNALRQELARVFPSAGYAISKGTHEPMESFVSSCMHRGSVEDHKRLR